MSKLSKRIRPSTRAIKVVKLISLAMVFLLLVANLVQYFTEPTPLPQLEDPTQSVSTTGNGTVATIPHQTTPSQPTQQQTTSGGGDDPDADTPEQNSNPLLDTVRGIVAFPVSIINAIIGK